jgi:ABC-type transporter Mla MlaB component
LGLDLPEGTVPTSSDGKQTTRDAAIVDLDVSWLVPCDLGTVFALARLQAAASRCGRSLLLHGVDGGLAELFEFVGLDDVMHVCRCCGASS